MTISVMPLESYCAQEAAGQYLLRKLPLLHDFDGRAMAFISSARHVIDFSQQYSILTVITIRMRVIFI